MRDVVTDGGQLIFELNPLGVMALDFTALVTNRGLSAARAGILVRMGIDHFAGDASQFVIDMNGVLIPGDMLPGSVTILSANYPLSIAPGETASLQLFVDASSQEMFNRQGTVAGFNWWINQIEVRDVDADALVGVGVLPAYDPKYEVRDWFKLQEGPILSPDLEMTDQPSWSVFQSS